MKNFFLSFIIIFLMGCATTPKPPKGAETIIFFNDVFKGIVEEYNSAQVGAEKK